MRLLTGSAHTFSLGTYLLDSHVIGYATHNDGTFAVPSQKLHLQDNSGKGQRWGVGTTHEQPLQYHLVKGRVGSTG